MTFLSSQCFLVTAQLHGYVDTASLIHLLDFSALHPQSCAFPGSLCASVPVCWLSQQCWQCRHAEQPPGQPQQGTCCWATRLSDKRCKVCTAAVLSLAAARPRLLVFWVFVLHVTAFGCSSCGWCGVEPPLLHDSLCSIEHTNISIILLLIRSYFLDIILTEPSPVFKSRARICQQWVQHSSNKSLTTLACGTSDKYHGIQFY